MYDNIRRFAGYHFCSNVGELVPFLVWGITGGAVPLPLVVMQVLAIDLGTDMLPAIALGTERAEPATMERPPRPQTERLLNRGVLARIFGGIGPLEVLAAMASFLFAYWLAGWGPWKPLAGSGELYRQATTMTMDGIVSAVCGFRTLPEQARSRPLRAAERSTPREYDDLVCPSRLRSRPRGSRRRIRGRSGHLSTWI